MSSSLGTASLNLTADGSKLKSGLDKSEKDVKGWGSRVGGMMKKGIGAGVGSLAKGGAMGLGIAAATAGVNSLTAPIDKLHDTAKQGDIAQSLGLTSEAFTGIAGVAKSAGSDTRDFLEGLVTLSGKAMDAAAGSGEETQKIFQALGVDAAKFAALNPEQQFYKLFEALNQVQNPAERVNLLLKAVGEDTGKNMVSLLGKSTEELKKQAAGFAISTRSMAEAQVASQQLKESQALLDKAGTDLTISLAPLVAMLADQLPQAIQWTRDQFTNFAPPAVTALRNVVQGVGFLMDVWEGAKSGVQFFVGAVVSGFGVMVNKIGEAIKFVDQLAKAMNIDVGLSGAADVVKEFGKFSTKVGFGVMDDANNQFKKFGEQQQAALAWFDGIMQRREGRVNETLKKLQPGGQIPREIKTAVTIDAMKGVEASIKGSQRWQETIARTQTANRFNQQNKQLEAQQKGNAILEQIKMFVSRPAIQFGLI